MTAARRVSERHEFTVHDDADAGRSSADVDDGAVADLQQSLRGGDLVDQAPTGHAGFLQHVATRSASLSGTPGGKAVAASVTFTPSACSPAP